MIIVSRSEQRKIEKRFSNVYFHCSKFHIFCEPRPDIIRFLQTYRKTH